jgi:hypothetical protein
MVRKSNRPGPRSAALSGSPGEHYVPYDFAVGRDLIVVAGFACGLKHEISHGRHHAIGARGESSVCYRRKRQCRRPGPTQWSCSEIAKNEARLYRNSLRSRARQTQPRRKTRQRWSDVSSQTSADEAPSGIPNLRVAVAVGPSPSDGGGLAVLCYARAHLGTANVFGARKLRETSC